MIATVLVTLVLSGALNGFGAEPRVLVYQKNGRGFVHDNLAASAAAIRELGEQNGFGVEVSTNAAVFADETLKQYRALIFANSNNEAFENEGQRAAFQRYIRGGGGFMGIHSSTGSERQWEYFQQLQGARFLRHSPLQKFTVNVLEGKHPATAHLASTWKWEDECYFFTNLNPRIQVLLAADTTTLKDAALAKSPAQKAGGVFPLAAKPSAAAIASGSIAGHRTWSRSSRRIARINQTKRKPPRNRLQAFVASSIAKSAKRRPTERAPRAAFDRKFFSQCRSRLAPIKCPRTPCVKRKI